MKKVSVTKKKDGSKAKGKSIMVKLGNYTAMYARRACNVDTGLLKASNVLTHTATGFILSNAAEDKYTKAKYARWVHDGHGGPIPYAGNPWMKRGLASAMKLLRFKKVSVRED